MVGLEVVCGNGVAAGPDRPLAVVHARDESSFAAAAKRLRDAYILGEAPAAPSAMILDRVA